MNYGSAELRPTPRQLASRRSRGLDSNGEHSASIESHQLRDTPSTRSKLCIKWLPLDALV